MNPTRPTLGLLAGLTATTAIVALPSAATALLSERDPVSWWAHHGTASAAMAVLHLAAMAAAVYVTLVLALVTAASALRRPRLAFRLAHLGPGAIRRWLTVGVLAGTLAAPSAGAQSPAESRRPASAIVADAPIMLVDLGPAAAPAVTAPTPPRESFRPAPATPTPDAWLVEPGDHLWSIAAATVTTATGHEPSTAQVRAYWHTLIEANAANVTDPDLIHPGQVLDLPPVVRAGS